MFFCDGISNEIDMPSNDNEVLLDAFGLVNASSIGLILGAL
jgi:hypothetical protein